MTSAGGIGLSSVCASALTAAGDLAGSGLTDSNGDYTVQGLAGGSYKVQFTDCNPNSPAYASEYFDDQPTLADGDSVEVIAPDTTPGIDAQLEQAGSISGTATLPGGGAAAQLCVGAYGPSAEDAFDIAGTTAVDTTDGNGDYEITGLNPGTYRLIFGDCEVSFETLPPFPSYANEAYSDKATLEQGDPVAVSSGGETVANAEVALGGRIRGTVSDAGGPVGGVCVGAEDPVTGDLVAGDVTGNDGDYKLAGVPVGSWAIRFFTDGCEGGAAGLQTEYHDDAPDRASSTPVAVAESAVVSGIDAAMAPDPPPETTIVSGPTATSNQTDVAFAFDSNEAGTAFECRLDGPGFAPCSSPQPYSSLADGTYTFEVRAVDAIGQPDPTPASRTWTVDTASPTQSTAGTAEAGDTVGTDPDGSGATPAEPVTVAITTPNPGEVEITVGPASPPPAGFTFLGQEIEITAPDATVANPLRFVFTLDASAIPGGTDPQTVQVFRNDAAAGNCAGDGTATPDPCVESRTVLAGGDLEIAVLTSQASTWNFGVAEPVSANKCHVPLLIGRKLAAAKAKIAQTTCKLGDVTSVRTRLIPPDIVLFQKPLPFMVRAAGTEIDLVVSARR